MFNDSVLLSRFDGPGSRRQVALGGALRQDAERGDGPRPRRPRQGRRRAGEAGAGGRRRRHARDPARDGAPHRRRHRRGRPPRAGEGRGDALRGDAGVARGARAARARAPARTAARRRPRGTSDEAGATAARRAAAGTAPAVKWVVLLRAVNLGARNKVPMAELRTLLEDAGYGDVRTYIASGNVLLDGPAARSSSSRAELERLVADAFDVTTTVILRKPTRSRRDRERAPVRPDTSDTHVAFLAKHPREGRGRPARGGRRSERVVLAGAERLPPATTRRARTPDSRPRGSSRCSACPPRSATGARSSPWPSSPQGRRLVLTPSEGRIRWHWHASLRSRASTRTGSRR